MRGLSIIQPWASLIVGGPLHAGVKRTENRSRYVGLPAKKFVGERIAIHASKKFDAAAWHVLMTGAFGFKRAELPYETPDEFPVGAIVGVATLERVFWEGQPATEDEQRFYTGAFGLSFGDRRFVEPIACPGALGFWHVLPGVEGKLRERIARAAA